MNECKRFFILFEEFKILTLVIMWGDMHLI